MSKYNGWSNYETWRINLEFGLCDGDYQDFNAEALEEHVTDYIYEYSSGLAQDYAMVFVAEVDWEEIEENIKEN